MGAPSQVLYRRQRVLCRFPPRTPLLWEKLQPPMPSPSATAIADCAQPPTLCKAREYTSSHSELSISPCTSSHVMNCPMFRIVRVGGQMSHPCTLRLHCQMVRRHLASKRATPLAPNVNGTMHSYQGTSSSEMPWTTNCNQRVVCQVGSTVSRVSSSSPMSRRYMAHCPWLPPEHSNPPPAEDPLLLSPHCLHGGPAYAEFGNHLPMPFLD